MPGVAVQVRETLARVDTLERDIAAKLAQVSALQAELAAVRARVELERAQPAAARLADVVERASAVQDAATACEFPAPHASEEAESTQETTLGVEWGAVARLVVAMRLLGLALDEPELIDGAVEALKSRGYEGEVDQVAGELCEVPPESEKTDVEPVEHEEPRSEAHLEETAT